MGVMRERNPLITIEWSCEYIICGKSADVGGANSWQLCLKRGTGRGPLRAI